jgi:hypothetical protein
MNRACKRTRTLRKEKIKGKVENNWKD